MGIPVSLLVIVLGAILAFAVTGSASGVNVQAVGWILVIVGIVGLVLSLILWDSWAGRGFWRRRAYYEAPPGAGDPRRGRRIVREDVEERL
jgi:Domain of unknown function (DUF6458)